MCDVTNTNELNEEVVTPVEENAEVINDTAEEAVEVEVPDAYTVNFSLSYSQYLKGQNKTEITNEEAAALIASLVNYYENEASLHEVKQFFEIQTDVKDEDIQNKRFNVTTEVVSNEAAYQILLTKYTLTFGERAVPEVVEEVLTEEPVVDAECPLEGVVEPTSEIVEE